MKNGLRILVDAALLLICVGAALFLTIVAVPRVAHYYPGTVWAVVGMAAIQWIAVVTWAQELSRTGRIRW